MKFSLTLKMMLVVAIPLAIQLIFIAILSGNLNKLASEQATAQQAAKVVMAHDQIIINERQRTVLVTMYLATADKYCLDRFREFSSDSPGVFNILAGRWKNYPEKLIALDKLWKNVVHRDRVTMAALMNYGGEKHTLEDLLGPSDPNRYLIRKALLIKRIPFIEKYCEQDKAEEDAAYGAIAKRMSFLKTLLWAGLLASILASIASELVFSRSVSKRLLLVLKNIKALGEKQSSLVEMKDSDEISSLNQAVVQTATKIRDAEEFQAQTIAIIAEELNKPLTQVAATLQELPGVGFEDLNPKGTKRLQDSLTEIERLERLVFELVNLDSANRTLDIAAIETDAMISRCLKIVEPLTKLKGIEVSVIGNADTEAFGDIAKTTQVLINLLSNAIKYSPEGSSIEINVTPATDYVKISVSDHGQGISDEFQSRIFQRFEQAHESTKPAMASSGLGLMISKEIIESQGGNIGFDSKIGVGSTFWFTLPVTKLENAQAPAKALSDKEELSWKPTLWKKALLVVALPVVVQSITIVAMFNFLTQNSEKILETQKIAQTTTVYEKLMTGISSAGLYSIIYNVERDPKNLTNARLEQSELRKNIAKLEQLTAGDATTRDLTNKLIASIKAHLAFEDHVLTAKQNADITDFLGVTGTDKAEKENLLVDIRKPLNDLYAHQNALIESNTQSLGEIRKQFELLLLFSAIASSAVAAALGLLIAKSLTTRASRLSRAALQFSTSRELIAPSAGNDELAYVEQQLYAASKKLMELEVARAEMVGITSHELRTPLTSLIALIEVIEAGVFGTLTPEGKSLLARARLETSELIVLITNLLDLEKMESGKILITKQRINVEQVFEQIKFDNFEPAQTKDIALNIQDCAQEIEGDSQRLSQALTAVIRSILERMPPKSAVSLDCSSKSGEVALTISAPHGIAVGSKNKTKEFARERMAISLARMTAQQHGGHFQLTTSNKGRMFELVLPLT